MNLNNQTTNKTLEQKLAELELANKLLAEENSKLLAKKDSVSVNGLSMRVSEKQALSVYGLGRFPITLYKSQWLKLIANINAISEFISINNSKLIDKGSN